VRAQTGSTTISSAVGTVTTTATWTYDAQNRITQRHESNLGTITMFTAWDASGRPTAAHLVGAPDTLAFVYDDSARSQTATTNSPSSGVQSVATLVFDVNGNPVSSRLTATTPLGQFATDVTYSTTGTRQVCG
jgi:YD repeat-containing protein